MSRRLILWLVLICAAGAAFAWSQRLACDDAFISFRYARNLVSGHGLVYNPGECVEGYTNFLWTLMIAGAMALGADPLKAAWVLGCLFFALAIATTYLMALRVLRPAPIISGSQRATPASEGRAHDQPESPTSPAAAPAASSDSPLGEGSEPAERGVQSAQHSPSPALGSSPAADSPAPTRPRGQSAAEVRGREAAPAADAPATACLALLAAALLAFHPSAAAFSASGMETGLHLFLLALTMLAAAGALSAPNPLPWLAGLSAASALAILTRPDSALVAAICAAFALWAALRARTPRLGACLAALILPAAAILGPWLAWKLAFYGDILPNTFYAKLGVQHAFRRGICHTLAFLIASGLLVFIPLAFAALPRLARSPASAPAMVLAISGAWLLYHVYIGGDFMEFRLAAPALPAMVCLVMWLAWRAFSTPKPVAAALTAYLFIASAAHLAFFDDIMRPKGMMSISGLRRWLGSPDHDWDEIGRRLRQAFGERSSVIIAVKGAGAIPYYSGLFTIDMHGLADKWVAHHGVPYTFVPGHRKIATLDYLLRRKVNLVLGNNIMLPHDRVQKPGGWRASDFLFKKPPPGLMPRTAKVIAMPVNDQYSVVMLYLLPHPDVERAIRRFGWKVMPLAHPDE